MSLSHPVLPEISRRERILDGAMRVFLAYGFQRTTMDDIARAAEISRPALYLEFRNKTDIYRALAEQFVEKTSDNARSTLGGSGRLEMRVFGALDCAMCLMAEIEESPHGAEILDMKNSLAADIVSSGRARIAAMLAEAIQQEIDGGRFTPVAEDVDAGLLAGMILDALDGLKLRNPDRETQNRLALAYVQIVLGTGLRAQQA